MEITNKTDFRLPLYAKIHQLMKEKILKGAFAVGEKVPQEDELCKQYNVSAITIRKAMSCLVEDGLVERVRGTGTFIKSLTAQNQGDSKNISLIFANRYGDFPGNIIAGAELAARKFNYKIQVHVSNEDYDLEREHLQRVLHEKPAGVILLCVWHRNINPNCDIYLEFKRQGVPLVLIDRYIPMLPLDYVVNSDFDGGYSITEHFINLGHKKIGYIREPEGLTSVEARYSSFQKAMADKSLPVETKYTLYCMRSPHNPNPVEEYYNTLLDGLRNLGKDLPTAFLCETDHMAIALYMAMMTLGIKVPEDVAVGGFGDSPMGSILPIPLTTVMQQQEQLGSKAVEVILERIGGKKTEEPIQISLSTKLIVRNSCGSDIPDSKFKYANDSVRIGIKDTGDKNKISKNKKIVIS